MKNLLKTMSIAISFLFLLANVSFAQDNQVKTDYTPLPMEKYYETTPYLSGGLGVDTREDMRQQLEGYNLKLVFANDKGAYLAAIDVRIVDEQGRWVLDAKSEGPWFYTRLPAGNYTVLANFEKVLRLKKVSLGADTQKILHLVW